jgi:hypothetical protein
MISYPEPEVVLNDIVVDPGLGAEHPAEQEQ